MDYKYALYISALSVILLLCINPAVSCAQPPCEDYDECLKLYVPYVKEISASKIDPSLPDVPFAKWLEQYVEPGSEKWEVNDCGEQTGFPDEERDYPVCVGVEALLKDGSQVTLYIVIGTVNRGIVGGPELFGGYIGHTEKTFQRLSDLPGLIRLK